MLPPLNEEIVGHFVLAMRLSSVSLLGTALLAPQGEATLCDKVTCKVETLREQVDFGVYDFQNGGLLSGGCELASTQQLIKYKAQLIDSYNAAGGLKVLKPFQAGNCCFAVKGGNKLILSVTKYGYIFPASSTGALRCDPALMYDSAALYKFYGTSTLRAVQNFSEKPACATSHNPGIFIKLAGGHLSQHIRVRHHNEEETCGKYKSLGISALGRGIYKEILNKHQCALTDTGACECHLAGTHPSSHLNKLDPGKVVTTASRLTGIELSEFSKDARLGVAHAIAAQIHVLPTWVQLHNVREGTGAIDLDIVVRVADGDAGQNP